MLQLVLVCVCICALSQPVQAADVYKSRKLEPVPAADVSGVADVVCCLGAEAGVAAAPEDKAESGARTAAAARAVSPAVTAHDRSVQSKAAPRISTFPRCMQVMRYTSVVDQMQKVWACRCGHVGV